MSCCYCRCWIAIFWGNRNSNSNSTVLLVDRAIGWGIDFYPIYRRGSIKMCHVRKHGTWHDFMTCLKRVGAKTKIDMYKMDTNVQYMWKNTSLELFWVPKALYMHMERFDTTRIPVFKYGHGMHWHGHGTFWNYLNYF